MSQTKAQLLDNIKDNVQLDARNSLRFADTDSSHYVAFKAPATVSSNVTWTLPAADGSANYVLATDGSGTLSWIADPAGQWVTSGSNIYFTGGNVGIGDSSPSNPLSVTGASAFNGDVTLTGASYNVTWDKSADDLIFDDNAKSVFGTGGDMWLIHDGTNSTLQSETGNLRVRTVGQFQLTKSSTENMLIAIPDGAVELYYDNSKKFETISAGIKVTGNIVPEADNTRNLGDGSTNFNSIWASTRFRGNDNVKLNLGGGQDLLIYHDATDNIIASPTGADLHIKAGTGDSANEICAKFIHDGAVELYYDNTKRFETNSTGAKFIGNLYGDDNAEVRLGDSGDFQLFHNSASGEGRIYNSNAAGLVLISNLIKLKNQNNNETMLQATADGAVELYHNNNKKLETSTYGTTLTGNLFLADSSDGNWGRIKVGTGEDLQIYHDGTASYIDEAGTGSLIIQSNTLQINNAGGTEVQAKFTENGAVELYYDNVKTFETTGGGGIIRGTEGGDANLFFYADEGDDNADQWRVQAHSDGAFKVLNYASGSWETSIRSVGNGAVELYHDNAKVFETDSEGVQVTGYLQAHLVIGDSDYTAHDWHVLQSNYNSRAAAIIEHSGDNSPYGLVITFTDDNPDNNSNYFITCTDTTNTRFKVFSDGDVVNNDNSYGATSDVKLKENIVDAGSQWDDIKAVKVRNFNFKTDTPSDKRLGVIAQELETVSPGLVSDNPDLDKDNNDLGTTTKSVKYSILYMKAIKALQEAMAKIETLETKVAALESA